MTIAAAKTVKLTAKERHALAELAKPAGRRDYSRVHGRTIHALERKGLFGGNGKPGGVVTPAGRAELTVPDIFADLFAKETAMSKTQNRPKKPSNEPLDEFRQIEFVETTLHDPVRDRWKEGACQGGVRLYCTASPHTHGEDNARWTLLICAHVRTRRGRPGKRFAIGSASMSRNDLRWLRNQIDAALRRKS
jgi:hypothetical protein